ncbi:hypothetical protein [Spiroplasma endosymbiont of Othius punctulatus]|uniref:hypothetical protein n=1 Tax=Spiroplasma endosymbiont of Othius punctulatus TaxID=3066289 RepID=UPI0030D5B8E5
MTQTESEQKALKMEKMGVEFTRMYFSTRIERIGRSILLLSQVVMLVVFMINFASLSAFIASKLPIHEVINAIGIADAFFRSTLIALTTLGMLVCLAFMVPLLVVKNAKAVKDTGQIIFILGLAVSVSLLIWSIISISLFPVKFNILGIVLAVINIALISIGSIMMISSSSKLIKKVTKAIDDSNDLGIETPKGNRG